MAASRLDFPPGYPEILADLAGLIHARLVEREVPDASSIATELAEDIRRQWGGGLIYIPKGVALTRHQRNDEVARAYNGRNHAELARRFGVTLACIYAILARKRGDVFNAINSASTEERVKAKHDNQLP